MLVSIPPVEKQNDRQFISDLYERYGRIMYSKAMIHLSDPQDVDDLIQDCLERLIKNTTTLRALDECKLLSYITITVRNAAINLSKRHEVQARHTFLTDFEDDAPVNPVIQPEEYLLSDELSTEFMKVFDTLPEEDQILFRGKYLQGLNDAELAALFGCAASSIRMKLTRARRRALGRLLEGGYFSEQT